MGKLYDELRQSRKYERPAQEAAVAILRTADVLRARIELILKPHGLSQEQYNALRILRGAPGHSLPTLEIAARMVSRAPNITRLVDKLVEKGHVTRCPGPDDRRQVVVRLSAKGLELVNRASPEVDAADVSGLSRLKPAQIQALIGLLDEIRATVEP